MKTELFNFISKIPSLTEEEVSLLVENLLVRSFSKGEILLKEGQKNSACYFVLKGCVRQYFYIDGEEKTTAFFTEEQAVVLVTSYLGQTLSRHNLACVEDSILIVGDYNQGVEMYEKFPKLQSITRLMMEQDYGKTQETLTTFITSSPEERYLNLLKTRPELLQRAPQHQIASYLGIKPESLSRIRKRIFVKK